MTASGLVDLPWTTDSDGNGMGADCRVAFLWCYKIFASRKGYNVGSWSTCSDCVAYNSLIEDAQHAQDLVVPVVDAPQLGDIIAYSTIWLPGHPLPWIGHGAIVIGADRATAFDPKAPQFHSLDIMQVCGPANRMPAAIATDGSVFDAHSAKWPKPEHRSRLLRAKS